MSVLVVCEKRRGKDKPGLSQEASMKRGRPTAAMRMSALATFAGRSSVWEWQIVTVAFS